MPSFLLAEPYCNPHDTALMIAASRKHRFATQDDPPPSISHPLHASNKSLTPHNLHHLILVDLIKHTRAEDFPHLRRSITNVTVRLLRKRPPQSRYQRWGRGVQLAELHVIEFVVQCTEEQD